MIRSIIIAIWWLLFATSAFAHKPSDSYLTIKADTQQLQGQWDIALRDLDYAIGLDANLDGNIEWGEVKAKHAEIVAYAFSHLKLVADGSPCPSKVTDHKIDNHSDGAYAVLYFAADCPKTPLSLGIDYTLFFDLDKEHKGLLNLQSDGKARSAIFGDSERKQTFQLANPSKWKQFVDYLVEGIWHIWIGLDHILFLLSLLLPAVLVWSADKWLAARNFGQAFLEVLKVVTAFTIAHSITLSLAALGIVELPTWIAESAIAASVVVAAMNNVYPIFHGRRWVVAFLFGLIHGFGFANVLTELGLPDGTLLIALVGFNLGVEVGQVAIVAVFLPLAFALRKTWVYQRLVLVAGSLLIAVVAAAWLVERVFDLKFMPI
ncbi:MAG: HupE/UreJ family protein [Burkholderiales bacterium]